MRQAEELKASIRPITEIAETIKAPFESLSQTTEITKNMTSALEAYVAAVQPIIRTADLNRMGLLSREIAELTVRFHSVMFFLSQECLKQLYTTHKMNITKQNAIKTQKTDTHPNLSAIAPRP